MLQNPILIFRIIFNLKRRKSFAILCNSCLVYRFDVDCPFFMWTPPLSKKCWSLGRSCLRLDKCSNKWPQLLLCQQWCRDSRTRFERYMTHLAWPRNLWHRDSVLNFGIGTRTTYTLPPLFLVHLFNVDICFYELSGCKKRWIN